MNTAANRVVLRDIMQAILAVGVTVLIAVMLFKGMIVPDPVWAGWGLIIGFFYGGMGKQNGTDLHTAG